MEIDRYKETFESWDKLATLYQDKFMDLNLYNETYDFICHSLIKENAMMLEIGCGPGNITKYLLSKRPDLNILATDISPNMIELAKRNNPSARVAVMDCRHIDQINTTFDAVICGFCIPYLSPVDCHKLIYDTSNILNRNGLLYVSFVEGDPEKSGFQHGVTGDRTYFYFYDLDKLKLILNTHNFEIIQMFKIEYKKSEAESDYHTVLIAQKP